MNLTKKSSYGLIAALALADPSSDAPRSAASIAEAYALPISFMEKILHELRRAGLVQSKQGRAGGYSLARTPDRISVRDVLEALGETLDLVRCLSETAQCSLEACCPTQAAWRHVDDRLKSLLDSMSLQTLLDSQPAERNASSP
jgi:Rrf2 family transcriptional regulator, iron-sulfur cluster assembly transcription factor